ncbi:hypothetical protein BASA81_012836 [Batrachochytrium salamandrivorans]|nr:hypothetical protein BASA81_012836 [Batrachochytrium salamandrivorans]
MRIHHLAMLSTVASAAARPSSSSLLVTTWNIAAINNNPFEYHIDWPEDPRYAKLMTGVQDFMSSPEQDIAIEQVFSDNKYDELSELMHREMNLSREVLQQVKDLRWSSLKKKKIVSGFLKDAEIGKKRFASMPDRQTNTLAGGRYRPTAINCYPDAFDGFEDWWKQWKHFMFAPSGGKLPVCQLLKPIPRSKYPELTVEDEALSLPLQTISLAVFDSILIHMLETVAPQWWQELRAKMCLALNSRKNVRIVEILNNDLYAQSQVVCLQETSIEFLAVLQAEFASKYWVLTAEKPTRDQNSVVLLSKQVFVTPPKLVDVFAPHPSPSNVENGDLVTVNTGTGLLVASFHGDTDGLATLPVLRQVVDYAKQHKLKLVFGLDANAYDKAKPGKQLNVREFNQVFRDELGLTSCFGDEVDPTNYTTFNARTFLQPQLNKAAGSKQDFFAKGDVNPKDFVLSFREHARFEHTKKDNTGKGGVYVEGMVFPTLTFPSDHGVLSSELVWTSSTNKQEL